VNKMVVEELLFYHDIKPPYTIADQNNGHKSKMSFNIRYPIIIFVVYQREKVNYMNNNNAFYIHESGRRNRSGLGKNYV